MKDSARANDKHALHLSPQSCHWEVAWHRSWRSQPSTSIPLMDMSLCCKAWGMDGWWARTMSHRFGSQSRIGMSAHTTEGSQILDFSHSRLGRKCVFYSKYLKVFKVGQARCSTQILALSVSQDMFPLERVDGYHYSLYLQLPGLCPSN